MSRFVLSVFLVVGAVSIVHVSAELNKRVLQTDEPEWTYVETGTNDMEPLGPSAWFNGYPDCAGDSQSPINLSSSTQTAVERRNNNDLEFTPHVCMSDDLEFLANERVFEVLFGGCEEQAFLTYKRERYNLIQFHIHSPSEHATAKSLHAAELHWVHLKDGTEDELLVVGVLFDVSEYGTNVELQPLWEVLGMGQSTTTESFETRVYDLMPSDPAFSNYMGSLTTPPCSEGVTWIVMNEPAIMSKTQLDEYREYVATFEGSKVDENGNTNRPLQPLNGREVLFIKA